MEFAFTLKDRFSKIARRETRTRHLTISKTIGQKLGREIQDSSSDVSIDVF
jgi:predicted transcriptional regulator